MENQVDRTVYCLIINSQYHHIQHVGMLLCGSENKRFNRIANGHSSSTWHCVSTHYRGNGTIMTVCQSQTNINILQILSSQKKNMLGTGK